MVIIAILNNYSITYNGQAYLFSPSSKSGLVDFSKARTRVEQPLISRLISNKGSKVFDVLTHSIHCTIQQKCVALNRGVTLY